MLVVRVGGAKRCRRCSSWGNQTLVSGPRAHCTGGRQARVASGSKKLAGDRRRRGRVEKRVVEADALANVAGAERALDEARAGIVTPRLGPREGRFNEWLQRVTDRIMADQV